MPDQIPENVKAARLAKLDTYLNEVQREFNESCIDQTLSCLLEGPDKTGRHLVYRTPFMQQCIVEYRDNAPELTDITITAANKASLRGKFSD